MADITYHTVGLMKKSISCRDILVKKPQINRSRSSMSGWRPVHRPPHDPEGKQTKTAAPKNEHGGR
jgi:hypothetical protein